MDNPSPFRVLLWIVVGIVVIGTVMFSLGAAFGYLDTIFDRKVVEQSQQYAETNASAFYVRADAIAKIDVQLAALPPDDPQREPLRSQRALLVGEARREVAKIPSDARTPEMNPYLPGAP